jgi:hypothetical protein
MMEVSYGDRTRKESFAKKLRKYDKKRKRGARKRKAY